MKKILLATFIYLTTLNFLSAQCNQPLPPGQDFCSEAVLLCAGLDAYCSTLPIPSSQFPLPGCATSIIDNAHYFKFVAGSSFLELSIEPSNCAGGNTGLGIQAGIYGDCSGTDLLNPIAVDCGTGMEISVNLTAVLEVGQTYYLIVDGYSGAICDYEISVLEGSTVAPNIDGAGLSVEGPSYVQNNMTYEFSTQDIVGVNEYNWTVTGGDILAGSGSNVITVEITDDYNFSVCVFGWNDCYQTSEACQSYEINPDLEIIEETICDGECFEINNTLFCETGEYDIEVDNGPDTSFYRIILTVTPPIFTDVDTHICFGDVYESGGEIYNQTGSYSILISGGSSAGCDSTVLLNLTVLDEDEPILNISNSGDLDCENPTVTLSVTASWPDLTYQWSGPGINSGNENAQNPEVELPGVYTVLVTTTSGCSNEASIEVFGDGPPEITVEGNNPLNCNNHENTITVSTNGQNADYEWTGPNGFSETGPEIIVDETGDYILIVNYGSGCTDTTIIVVTSNNDPLFVDPGPNRHIQCEFILTLDAPGAAGTNVAYEWTTTDGSILFGENTLNPVVNTDGTYTLTATDLDNGCTGSADMIVYGDMAQITNDVTELTCLITEVVLDGSESYNGPDAFIQWTTNNGNIVSGENTLTPLVNAPGVYQLVVIRPGCLSFASAVVLDNAQAPIVDIDASIPNLTCSEFPVLTGSTDATNPLYIWYLNGVQYSSDTQITVTQPGTYLLEVTGSNGCIGSSSVFVGLDQDPEDILIIGDLILDCASSGVGELSVIITGNSNFYDIEWFTPNGEILGGNTFEDVTILGQGTYCVEVTNIQNGCSLTECIDVTETSTIELNAIVNNVSCPNANDGSILLNVSGGTPPYQYYWVTGQVGNTALFNLSPGNYGVTVVDITGCEASQTFTIGIDGTAVDADAGEDQALDCQTNSLVLDGGASVFPPGSTFVWETNDGTIDEGEDTLFPTVSSIGTYTLTILSPEGCEDGDEVTVTDYSTDAGPDQTLDCNNASIELQGVDTQPGATYEWSTSDGNIVSGENTLNPTVDSEGTYTLTTTLSNGCTAIDEVEVDSDYAEPDVSLDASEYFLTDCLFPVSIIGESTTPNASYEWIVPPGSSPSSNSTYEAGIPGSYTLVVTGPNGCTSSASAEVFDIATRPEVSGNPSTQYINCFNGNPLLLDIDIFTESGQTSVDWTTQDGNINDEVGNSVKVDQAGTYVITVEDPVNGCVESASVLVEEQEALISIETTIASCGIPDATATVNTEFIHNPEYNWSTGETTASIANLAPGIYMVTVSSENSTCDEIHSVEIIQDPSCFVIVSGYIYDDPDELCDENGNISPKENVLVTITPEDMETYTDANGYYEFLVPPGDYTVAPELVSPFVVECPSESISVSVPPGSSGSEDNNFFVKALSGFDLYVTAGSGGAYAGSNQSYQISFCNNWFTTIFGTVEFTHDPNVVFDPVASGADSYDPVTRIAVWEYVDLSFFECEYISFAAFIPEDVPDGTVITSSVIILPTQGDIAPSNNSTSWTRTVNNTNSNTSMIGNEDDNLESNVISSSTEEPITIIRQYPNPFSERVTLEFDLQDASDVEVQLFDANGRFIKSYNGFENGFNSLTIRGSDLAGSGLFIYKITSKRGFKTGRFIKH